MKVIGIKKRSGEYNGISFVYYDLHCVYESKENDYGQLTTVVKCKQSILDSNVKAYLGKDIKTVLYDKYGKVAHLEI